MDGINQRGPSWAGSRRSFLKSAGVGVCVTTSMVGTSLAVSHPTVYINGRSEFNALDADNGSVEWSHDIGGDSSPVVKDGIIYVGSDDRTLYAVEAESGEEVWSFTEPETAVTSSPTIVDGTVYVGTNGPSEPLYAVDARSGDEEWSIRDPEPSIRSSPTVVEGTLYVGGSDGTLRSVDTDSEDINWEFQPSQQEQFYSSPTVAGNLVYIGNTDGSLYAVDKGGGDKEWSFTEPSSGIRSSPTIVDGTVYVGSRDGGLYAVDGSSGEQEWVFDESSEEVFSSPTVYQGEVYVGSRDGTLYALDADTGDEIWQYNGTGRDQMEQVFSSPTIYDDVVYVASFNGQVHAVDTVTGNGEWVTDIGTKIQSSPTIVEDPDGGDSSGTRVLLGTLGHHDTWASEAVSRGSPFFSVSITNTNTPVPAGEDLTIRISVENTGGIEDTQSVQITVGNIDETSEEIRLDGGESRTESVTVSTIDGDEGEHTVTVESENDTDTRAVNVESAPDDALFELSIGDLPDSVTAGEEVEVTLEIQNAGDLSETQTLELDGGELGTRSVSIELEGGETTTETLSLPTATEDGGEYTLTASTDDDSVTEEIEIEPAREDAQDGTDESGQDTEEGSADDGSGQDTGAESADSESGEATGEESADSESGEDTEEESADDDGAGFTVVNTVSALGGVGYLVKRKLGNDSSD